MNKQKTVKDKETNLASIDDRSVADRKHGIRKCSNKKKIGVYKRQVNTINIQYLNQGAYLRIIKERRCCQ